MLAAFSELKQTEMCFTCQLLVRFRLDIICNSLHGQEWTIIVSSGFALFSMKGLLCLRSLLISSLWRNHLEANLSFIIAFATNLLQVSTSFIKSFYVVLVHLAHLVISGIKSKAQSQNPFLHFLYLFRLEFCQHVVVNKTIHFNSRPHKNTLQQVQFESLESGFQKVNEGPETSPGLSSYVVKLGGNISPRLKNKAQQLHALSRPDFFPIHYDPCQGGAAVVLGEKHLSHTHTHTHIYILYISTKTNSSFEMKRIVNSNLNSLTHSVSKPYFPFTGPFNLTMFYTIMYSYSKILIKYSAPLSKSMIPISKLLFCTTLLHYCNSI